MIKAELQVVLNTLEDHNFQNAFKNGRRLGTVQMRKGTTSKVMMASRPKISVLPDGSTSAANYG
jgi:hypothetical protein